MGKRTIRSTTFVTIAATASIIISCIWIFFNGFLRGVLPYSRSNNIKYLEENLGGAAIRYMHIYGQSPYDITSFDALGFWGGMCWRHSDAYGNPTSYQGGGDRTFIIRSLGPDHKDSINYDDVPTDYGDDIVIKFDGKIFSINP
jgi:hypothetical protein